MNDKRFAVAISLFVLAIFLIGVLVGHAPQQTNPVNITTTETITIITTITVTQNLTSDYSREFSLNGVRVADMQYSDVGDMVYTFLSLYVPGVEGGLVCCDTYLFDGAVQGVPIGKLVNIGYREYSVGYVRHMVVTSIEALEN